MGMCEQEFWDITPSAFFNALEGNEGIRRMNLEVTRMQTVCQVNVWSKHPIRDPKMLWKYPWEKKEISRKEIEAQRIRGKMLAEKWKR